MEIKIYGWLIAVSISFFATSFLQGFIELLTPTKNEKIWWSLFWFIYGLLGLIAYAPFWRFYF